MAFNRRLRVFRLNAERSAIEEILARKDAEKLTERKAPMLAYSPYVTSARSLSRR